MGFIDDAVGGVEDYAVDGLGGGESLLLGESGNSGLGGLEDAGSGIEAILNFLAKLIPYIPILIMLAIVSEIRGIF